MSDTGSILRHPKRDLFLISFLILFFELAAIRWFAGTVVFITFFTNIVLLACFLGMSVGLLTASRPRNLVRTVLPLLLVALAASLATHAAYWDWADRVTVSVDGLQDSPRFVYYGTEYRSTDPSRWIIPMWAVGGFFFALIAVTFVGLGQVMGRAFDAIPERVVAYSVDVMGSLTGILAFAAMSFFQLPPTVWFVPIVALIVYFAGARSQVQLLVAFGVMVLVVVGSHLLVVHGSLSWSPYYKVSFDAAMQRIVTNDIAHQSMVASAQEAPAYTLPYLLNEDAGGRPFDDVMIIGAGSGNDVAAALRAGAKRVDAIEIDPRILAIGRSAHPERPYADTRVTAHLDDGRSFVRRTPRRYDLAIYALVDSLVLHSGYSTLRLENFLFTREAFEDIRRTLKPDGVFVMYNYYRQGWVVGRLTALAQQTFGTPPIVISLPYRASIGANDSQSGNSTFILASSDSSRLAAIRERFARGESLWIAAAEKGGGLVHGYYRTSPADNWLRIGAASVDTKGVVLVPTDDWPQLYLRGREIPWAPIGQGMVAMAALSLTILLAFAPKRRMRPNWQMFFLGAGFMLLETKGVVHMALLFGSTWIVNSIVFAAILVMILCANLYVLGVKPERLWPYYLLLIAALLAGALVPLNAFLSLPGITRTLASCAVVFVPVFFAGVVFASAFRRSREPDADFGWNVAGIIIGGLSEQLSLVLGFNHLLLVAAGFYLLSLGLRPRAA